MYVVGCPCQSYFSGYELIAALAAHYQVVNIPCGVGKIVNFIDYAFAVYRLRINLIRAQEAVVAKLCKALASF